jgi:4-amino-4-deoxy-L-arabinose transferase-like glycosyltransferase
VIAPTMLRGQDPWPDGEPSQDMPRRGGRGARRLRRHARGRRHWAGWPLAAVLAVQAILSARLAGANSAFQDEALYLWAGHLQWAHWLHHVPITPAFPSYFSGAPVIYPPVGALGDDIAGLVGARLISLFFMLCATVLLWSAARRLFGDLAAFCAAALFASTAAVQFLGAFATYDAMALLVLAAAAWCAIRSGTSKHNRLLLACVVALLVLANATKYASVLWDPVVFGLAGLAAARVRGWRSGIAVTACVAVGVCAALALAVLFASPAYWAGIRFSTLNRNPGGIAALTVLWQAAIWIGPVAGLAVAGAVLLSRCRQPGPQDRPGSQAQPGPQDQPGPQGQPGSRDQPGLRRDLALALTGWTLAAAVLLAPAQQARIHTTVSLFKHVGYGGWFGAIIAGYALAVIAGKAAAAAGSRLRAAARRSHALAAACAAMLFLLAAVAAGGAVQASNHYTSWPNSAALMARLGPLAARYRGPSLAEDPFVPSYYLRDPAGSWSSTWYFSYLDPVTQVTLSGIPAYADAIRRHYFKIVVIGMTTTPQADRAIENDLRHAYGYTQVAVVPWAVGSARGQYRIWSYQPGR